MQTMITEFLTAVGFGTVCIGVIVSFALLAAFFDVYIVQKMEKKINEEVQDNL